MNFPFKIAVRDLLLLLATLGAWTIEPTTRHTSADPAGTAMQVAAGVMAGLCAVAAHEWGHYLGARAAGAVVYPARRVTAVFMFGFDRERNGRREFMAMSWGGFVASAAMIALFVTRLPLDALSGQVAMAFAAVGVLLTAALELPVAWRVAHGAELPRGTVYVEGR
jgi:uncharacterized membrane protein